ncbi:MAG: alternative ribosome rescue aminoacyl-tRNA hydrolase ArfB [Verrucomicrobiota bacterium]|nr:alternative ribosome rescue aminoacyl-tRNA hydrolase ArfB [Verrucomicrobiota bacterium]
MLRISAKLSLPESEIDLQAVRSQGAGGQNVNKVSTTIQLFFAIKESSLPEEYKERLLAMSDHRISESGVIVIKSQEYRTQEQNREAAIKRLQQILRSAGVKPTPRKATKPSRASQRRRLDAKTGRAQIKSMRGRVAE